MAIVEGFCADLYCDCEGCKSGRIYPQVQVDFIGRNMTDISQQAREAGWRISKDRQPAMHQDTKFRGLTHEPNHEYNIKAVIDKYSL